MAPWECPDCGIWWAGLEHRCAPGSVSTGVATFPFVMPYGMAPFTPRCTCPPDRGDNYFGTCLVHDVHITYTT